jgi:hypothetical protein
VLDIVLVIGDAQMIEFMQRFNPVVQALLATLFDARE